MQVFRSRSFALCLVSAFALVFYAGCHSREEQSAAGGGVSGKPVTLGMLALMPDSAAAAIAFPSVARSYERLETLLMRGAPKNINMEAELKVLVSQAARSAGVYDASTVADIALAKGINPDAPLGIFMAQSKPSETPAPPVETQALGGAMLSRFGFGDLPPLAVVFTVAARQDAEKFVADWGGAGKMDAKDLAEPKTTLYTREDKGFAYFFANKLLVAGTSVDLVTGIAERMKTPGMVRYGTAACPAERSDEIVQLIRTDKLPAEMSVPLPGAARAMVPAEVRTALGKAWSGWLSGYKGSDPMVVTWQFGEDRLTVRSRLDYAQHAEAKQRLAAPARLAHLDKLPKGTVAVYTVQLTPQMKTGLKEMVASEGGAAGGLVGQMTASLGKVIDAAGSEVTIAATGPGAKGSRAALLLEFQDGDVARALLKELGMTPLVAEVYNNVEIYSLILPSPAPIYYALPKNTFVMAGSSNTVKDLIDAVNSGKATGFAGGLNPPLDTQAPRTQVLVMERAMAQETILPLVESYGTLSAERAKDVSRAFEKVRDLRMTTEVANDWQDTRVVLQLD